MRARPLFVWTKEIDGLMWGFIGVAVVLFVSLALLLPSSKPAAPPASAPSAPAPQVRYPDRVTAEVRWSAIALRVANQDSFTWSDVSIRINAGAFSNGYQIHRGTVAPGDVLTVPFQDFVNSNAERFNPFTHAVQSIMISASLIDEGGKRHSVFSEYRPTE